MELSSFNSQKFKFWSFVSMVLLVFVHGYNLQMRYLQPWTLPGEPFTITSFTEYFLSNGIFRFRIPMLFIISGFLYALHDQQPYNQRIKKRLRTLLIPYLIWSAFGLLLVFVFEQFTYTKAIIGSVNLMQIDQTRFFLSDYKWHEVLGRWIFAPVPYQLWFIRVLLIYNLAYPAIRWCVLNRFGRPIFFSVAFFMWFSTLGFGLFEGEGLLFFSIGVWIQKTNFSIDTPKRWLNPLWWGLTFVLFSAVKTTLAFIGQPILGDAVFPIITIMHKLVVVSGLITCWFGLNSIVKWFMDKQWFVWLSAFSFIIYALHAPLVAFVIDSALNFINATHGNRLIVYVGLPVVIITICIAVGWILRTITPRFYGLLTGGRGF